MLNLMKADWYQYSRKKSSWLINLAWLAIPLLLVLLIRFVIKYNSQSLLGIELTTTQQANLMNVLRFNEDFQQETIDLAKMLAPSFVFIFAVTIFGQIFNDEVKNRTFINTFSFGYKRRSVVLSKVTLPAIITLTVAILANLVYAVSAKYMLGSNFTEVFKQTSLQVIKAYPAQIAVMAMLQMLNNNSKHFWNIMVVFIILDNTLPRLTSTFSWLEKVIPYLPNSVIGSGTLYNSASYPVFLIVTFLYIAVMLVVSEKRLEKTEIK